MATALGTRGYSVIKSSISLRELEAIKDELTVIPFAPQDYAVNKPIPFKLYQESSQKIYLPKAYGLKKFGLPETNKINSGYDINVEFVGQLRPEQKEPVEKVLQACKDPLRNGGILSVPCAFGKCLGIDTPIIMFDGTIKMVQDVKTGDLLMGDDSTPRNVLSTCQGREMLYKVIPTKGDPYIVNESHILSLKGSTNFSKKIQKGQVYDIPVLDYLKLPKSYHGKAGPLLGYRVPIDFPTKDVIMDPYILGYWLGDGTSENQNITTQESTVIHYLIKKLPEYNLYLRHKQKYTYTILTTKKGYNHFRRFLKANNLFNNKHIPIDYKCNSRSVRLNLLAGIIDSDGYYFMNCYEIIQKRENLIDEIIYLARSLGFAAYKKRVYKTCTNSKNGPKTGVYYRTHIHGKGLEEIPVKVVRKKGVPRKLIKDVLTTRIRLEKLEIGDYYGFEIDGNHRFVLGDFTVTHNTSMAIYMMCHLHKKTMIIVHKEFLIQQWRERLEQFAPSAKIGLLKAQIIDVEDKDVVIASLQSLSMKEYDPELFVGFGHVIVDECYPYNQYIFTDHGPMMIGQLWKSFTGSDRIINILSFNINKKNFEWKKMTYAWQKSGIEKQLVHVVLSGTEFVCTADHKQLTVNGMIESKLLQIGDRVISYNEGKTYLQYVVNVTFLNNKEEFLYDIEVEDNHNFVCCSAIDKLYGHVSSNCHHSAAQVFSQALKKVNFTYSIGLSATPKRKDGMTKVFLWHLGDIAYNISSRKDLLQVQLKEFFDESPTYSQEVLMYRGKLNIARMINNICEFVPRVEFIVNIIKDLFEKEPERRILLLSDRRNHLQMIAKSLTAIEIDSGFFYGGVKEDILKESSFKNVILATFAYVSEGFDVKGLDTLILASPKSDIVQSSGRILRDKPEDRIYVPLVIDIVDNFSVFVKQAKKRYTYYKKCKYEIINDDDVFTDKTKVELPKNEYLIRE